MKSSITVNGTEVGLNPQMQKVLHNLLVAYVESLDGVEKPVRDIVASTETD